MSDQSQYPYYPEGGQNSYPPSGGYRPDSGPYPPSGPVYPESGNVPYPPTQPNTAYSQFDNYGQQPSYPPFNQQGMYQPQPVYAVTTGQTNGPGIASLVLGIIGIVTFWFPFVGFPVSIVGLVLATVGMKRIEGKGFAVAGLVLSIIGAVLSGCIFAALIAGLSQFHYY